MTDSPEIDEIHRKAKEKLERFGAMVPSRHLSPDETTQQLLNMYQLIVALQAECEMLKVWVDELKTHHHVAGDTIIVRTKQSSPNEPTAE